MKNWDVTRRAHFWFGVAAIVLIILFTLQNVGDVRVTLLFWGLQLPLAALIFVIFLVGIVVGLAIARVRRPR